MKQTVKLFQIGLKQISKDGMLLVLLPAPILVGLVFKFAVPYANGILEDQISFSLSPWYGIVDGMLVCLTPMFAAMVSAFLLLEERDEGISSFYQITPAGGYSYLVARIGIPIIWAFAITILATGIFRISGISVITVLSSSFLSALTGISLAMIVVSLAGNRVEGLAVSKLMGLFFLGLIAVWFIPAPYSYLSAFLPSFWIGKLIMDGTNVFSFVLGLFSCFIWIIVFTRKFLHRIN